MAAAITATHHALTSVFGHRHFISRYRHFAFALSRFQLIFESFIYAIIAERLPPTAD